MQSSSQTTPNMTHVIKATKPDGDVIVVPFTEPATDWSMSCVQDNMPLGTVVERSECPTDQLDMARYLQVGAFGAFKL